MRVAENPLDAIWPFRCILPALHVQEAIERSEANHAKADQVRMARDVATMLDELRAMAARSSSCG
jgi:hypothetical protein